MSLPCVFGDSESQTLMNQEPVQTDAQTQEEVRKYLRMIPEVAEPNFARVLEIKEQIEQGTYLTREIIEETASRLALRFLRKE